MLGKRNGELHGKGDNDRGLIISQREYVQDWVPEDFSNIEHLGVFGGKNDMRTNVILQAIHNCYGKMGIVVIHYDDELIQKMNSIHDFFPDLDTGNVMQCSVSRDNPVYEPLYGIPEERVVEVIYPQVSRDNPSYLQLHVCSEALRAYLKIIKYNDLSIDIDILSYLCNLDLNELEECSEMQKVPESERTHILTKLMQHDNIYLQVRADINAFAGHLEGRIWHKKSEEEDTMDVSMISAVKQKNILTIKVPFNNHVADYLGSEIQTIIDEEINFLLVIDSVYVGPSLLNTEVLKMPELPFSTVIACDNLRGIYGDNESDIENALAKLDVIHVMQCTNNISAQPFTSVTGQYLRRFESTHSGSHREALHLLGGVDNSTDTHEELFDRIRPEEFAALGSGAVLIDQGGYDNSICVTEEFVF